MDDSTKHRLLAVGSLVGAVAHVVAPRALLEGAAWWYRMGLKVKFEPTDGTVDRVRLLAVPNLLAALYFWFRAADST